MLLSMLTNRLCAYRMLRMYMWLSLWSVFYAQREQVPNQKRNHSIDTHIISQASSMVILAK